MKASTLDKFLRRSELTPESTWGLLRLLIHHGANEFSVVMMGLEGIASPDLDVLETQLAPYSLGSVPREHITAPSLAELVRPTPIWTLNTSTEGILRTIFKGGLFEYPAYETDGGWVEEPSVYRDGDLMLSIISHESEGMLRLSEDEYGALNRDIDLPLHEAGEWI